MDHSKQLKIEFTLIMVFTILFGITMVDMYYALSTVQSTLYEILK